MDKGLAIQRIGTATLVVVVTYGIAINGVLAKSSISGFYRLILVLLSSAAVYRLLTSLCFALLSRMGPLLKLHWGRERYFHGYWHYTSERDGQQFLGVWRFTQTPTEIRVQAFGLDQDFKRRFFSHSVGSVLETVPGSGVYEVVNARDDYLRRERPVFTMTRFVPDLPVGRRVLPGLVTSMHGETFTFSQSRGGYVNRNVCFVRHPKVKSDQQMIDLLQELDPLGWRQPGASRVQ
ncbi:hypothetical protein ABZU53_27990 [Micromonospora sp. NPDC005194]|uniref:hypothetical protein n=1 Tax=Micromonospora sp. NPDC005194 TaxID=3156870 RepID=UPI00339DE2EA